MEFIIQKYSEAYKHKLKINHYWLHLRGLGYMFLKQKQSFFLVQCSTFLKMNFLIKTKRYAVSNSDAKGFQ